ncbi:T9SS C-terminal target domain-containing protein [Anditalea andensis]|uniref:PKD domain-containing protein n=1 Tax=Anditalea andensis TaxID=1048983 RepID=A0A074KYB8_9BACT|nr:T9SS C-terminal target domain-containing protein [Anditalea andensis]KEO73190.1 hypothetical protein EL17_12595 [Anditalea andensis]
MQQSNATSAGMVLSEMKVEVSGKLALCNHFERGEIVLKVTGGEAPYTYQWSNGADTDVISDLNAGTYTVKITDNRGAWISNSFIIQPPYILTTELINRRNASCSLNHNGEIELNIIRGRGPFTILWSHGLENETTATSLAPGHYSVAVTDYYNCTNTIEFEIGADELELIVDINTDCEAKGAISVEVKGGMAPYDYQWAHGPVSKDLMDLDSGIYELRVTDANGCATYKIIDLEPIPLSLERLVMDAADCSVTEAAGFKIIGGKPPYKIEWMDDPSIKQLVREGLSSGNYVLKVEDKSGCMVESMIHIESPSPLMVDINTRFDFNCNAEDIKGYAEVQIQGGSGPFSINWSSGETGLQEISLNNTGSVEVEVRDGNGCTVKAVKEVEFPQLNARMELSEILINVDGGNEFSLEEPIQFRANIPEDALAWEWDFGDGFYSDQRHPTHIYRREGEYAVALTIHDLFGCHSREIYHVYIEDKLDVVMMPNAFSPNGDGLNDTFQPKFKNITSYDMQIFNSWGELLFATSEMDSGGWTGYLHGSIAPPGNYVYKVAFTSLKGEKKYVSGVFTLVK